MIICLGTTPALQRTMTFDRLRLDAVNRAASVSEYASGKPNNVARVLTEIGRRCVVTGFLGGESGEAVRRDLTRAGIAHDYVTVAPATRLCITVVDHATGSATELIQNPEPAAASDWQVIAEKLQSLLVGAKVLVLCGSMPPGAPVDFYAQCVRSAKSAGVQTLVDAVGEPLRLALRESPTIVKPNRLELAESTGLSVENEHLVRYAALRLIDDTDTSAVITLGADGALAVAGDDAVWRVHVPTVKVISPIGSGDAFAAGLAAMIEKGRDLVEAARFGTACAVANALTDKAGHVEIAEVARISAEIAVEKIPN